MNKNRWLLITLFIILLGAYAWLKHQENSDIKKSEVAFETSENSIASSHEGATAALAENMNESDMAIQTWKTKANIPVYFLATQGLSIVDAGVLFDAGSARDGAQFGLANLTGTLIGTGTQNDSEDALNQRFEDAGAQFNGDVRRDVANVFIRMLTTTENKKELLQTFAEVIAHPVFKEDILTREKDRLMVHFKHELQSPSELVINRFFEAIYPSHPYGHPTLGRPETVKALTVADLKTFHQTFYNSENAKVVIVGNVSLDEAKDIAELMTAGLSKGERAQALAEPHALQAEDIHIPFASEQTHILMGMPLATRKDADWPALFVANEILGGSAFQSRLFEKIRHEAGLAYSVGSDLQPLQVAGPYMFSVQTRQQEAARAKELLRNTLNDFLKDGPTDEEVETAKSALRGELSVSLASNAGLLSQTSMIAFYDLPLQYLTEFMQKLNALSREEIQSVFAKHVHPEQMIMVTLGDETSHGDADEAPIPVESTLKNDTQD